MQSISSMIFPIESLNKLSWHFFVGVSIIPSLSKAALFLGVAFAAMPERTLANFCGVDGKHFFALYTAFLSASLLVYPDEVLFIGFSFFAFSYLARSLFSAYFSLLPSLILLFFLCGHIFPLLLFFQPPIFSHFFNFVSCLWDIIFFLLLNFVAEFDLLLGSLSVFLSNSGNISLSVFFGFAKISSVGSISCSFGF